MPLVLVLGGVRSGKSEVAERIAGAADAPVCYLATGSAGDPEMAERIERHRRRRPAGWRTVECDDPARAGAGEHETLLVDGVAPWLARLMREGGLWTEEAVAPLGPDGRMAWERALADVRAFARAAAARPGLTVAVAEQSGLGLIPQGAGVRRYLDLAGEAVQALAEPAERVLLVVAGRAIELGRSRSPAPPALPAGGPETPAPPTGGPPVPPWPVPPWPVPPGPPVASAPVRSVPPGLRVHGDAMVVAGQLDFAVNVVPGRPPAWLREELVAAVDRAGTYPDERAALGALGARHGRAVGQVLATNGSAEAFWLLADVLRPRCAVVVHPSFTEPEAALRAAGHRVERAFRNPGDFALDPSTVPDEADLVVLGNPNNPTGTLDPAAVLARLARRGRILVVDEAFMELVPGERESLAAREDLPGLVVVRSLTKPWALAGIRAGYLLAPPEITAAARAARQPWSVNGPACAALAAWARRTAASGGEEAAAMAGRVAAARAGLAAGLAALNGVRVWPSAANFLLLRVPDGPATWAGLAERGIAVRRADTFPGLTADHLRVAVRDPDDNRRLVEALRDVLEDLDHGAAHGAEDREAVPRPGARSRLARR